MDDHSFRKSRGKYLAIAGATIVAAALLVEGCFQFFAARHPPICAHSPCTAGAALDPLCDPCVAHICPDGSSSPCCNPNIANAWTQSACVQAVQSQCAQQCDCTQTTVAGEKFNPYACDCTMRLCSANSNPSCCANAWDSSCVGWVTQNFSGGCKPMP